MPSRKGLKIRKIVGSVNELTTEVLRLLVLYPHNDETLRRIGHAKEVIAARMCQMLPGPGGILTTADDGHRLKGLLHLAPVLQASAALGTHVWEISQLVMAPDATGEIATAMLKESLIPLDSPIDLITARVPATDACAIAGLQRSGFTMASSEVVAVARKLEGIRTRRDDSSIVPFEMKHIEAAARIACDCRLCSLFTNYPRLDPNRVSNLSRISLKPYVRANGRKGLVALDDKKDVRGFAAFSLDAEIAGVSDLRVASIDHLCVTADENEQRLEALLGSCILKELNKNHVRAVVIRLLVNKDVPRGKLDAVRAMGFEPTQSNLVMLRWLTRPSVRAA